MFHPDGMHPSSLGAELLSDNISKALHSKCLPTLNTSSYNNNVHHNQCSINSPAPVIHTIETVSVPQAIKIQRKSRKVCLRNLINIKLNHIECTSSTFNLKLGLLKD
ncbi:hypothetical protein AMELA_G00121670 [Ameiurus melas]|uniref:Uncharacterized protein n=1 Tax=Ameiurus melas TaxID=219545 RepID=A0A7J6AQJ7_AMEME|nr:hypothetical protein AMELA_G00121670 [Ameiurus melas]